MHFYITRDTVLVPAQNTFIHSANNSLHPVIGQEQSMGVDTRGKVQSGESRGHVRPAISQGSLGKMELQRWARAIECGLCSKNNGKSLTWVMNQESHVVRFNRDYLGSGVGEWIGEAGSVAV